MKLIYIFLSSFTILSCSSIKCITSKNQDNVILSSESLNSLGFNYRYYKYSGTSRIVFRAPPKLENRAFDWVILILGENQLHSRLRFVPERGMYEGEIFFKDDMTNDISLNISYSEYLCSSKSYLLNFKDTNFVYSE